MCEQNIVVEMCSLYNCIDFESSVYQAGPDIGDMELRRSMLEPEVADGHLQQLNLKLKLGQSPLRRMRTFGRLVRSLGRVEWTWIISIR